MRTVLYTFESPVTLAVAGRLVETGKISAVVLQSPMDLRDKLRFVGRRLIRYGPARVVDEILFKIYYTLFLKAADERLRATLPFDRSVTKEQLSKRAEVFEVDSLNSPRGRDLLQRVQPDLVIMMSREMLRADVLAAARLGFVGCHPGILPEYRGVYAPFWAMREGRADRVGLTVYLANDGVDTGPLVVERRLPPLFGLSHFKVEADRLMLEGVADLIDTIDKAERGALNTYTKPNAKSRMFSHVGLTDYLGAVATARHAR